MAQTKIKIGSEMLDILTVNEMTAAKKIVHDFAADKYDASNDASTAIAALGDWVETIYSIDARIQKNANVWDQYGDGSRRLDVWFDIVAKTSKGFVEMGVYLTEIYKIGMDDFSIRDRAYIREYRANV